jgi:hypothetical protein
MFGRGIHGSYAELTVAEETEVWHLPGGDVKQGAALGIPYLTAHRALIIKSVVALFICARRSHEICIQKSRYLHPDVLRSVECNSQARKTMSRIGGNALRENRFSFTEEAVP